MSDEFTNVTPNEFQNSGVATVVVTAPTVSTKSRIAATLLCFFLGSIGIHRFYTGKIGTGILMLLMTGFGVLTSTILIGIVPLGIVAIWVLIDLIVILCGGAKDGNGLPIKNW